MPHAYDILLVQADGPGLDCRAEPVVPSTNVAAGVVAVHHPLKLGSAVTVWRCNLAFGGELLGLLVAPVTAPFAKQNVSQ